MTPASTLSSGPRRHGACGALTAERCPSWLRFQQPHLVTGIMVVILPYVDLSMLRSTQLEASSFLQLVQEHLLSRKRTEVVRQGCQSGTPAEGAPVSVAADAPSPSDEGSSGSDKREGSLRVEGPEIRQEPYEGQKGVTLRGVSGKKRSSDGVEPQPKRSSVREAQGEQDLLRRNQDLLPRGFGSFFQFLGSPGGPKLPTRYIHIESGHRCPIVRVRKEQGTQSDSNRREGKTRSHPGQLSGLVTLFR